MAAAALLQMAVVGIQAAHADPTVLTVVGTSDVSDSGLMANVIMPGFAAANPDYTIKYIGEGTGAAIADAEAGNGAALIVHAPSLENQFVSGGYSLNNDYGRAIFWGDYVLAGYKSDPAGITAAGDGNNIVKSYADIAVAGIAGKAEFVSRGGTPGTTVAEHQVWAAMNTANEVPTGLQLCTVSVANGGGMAPIQAGSNGAGAPGAACPSTVVPPSWYVITGAKQAANIHQADVCASPGNSDCYVFTDRGTYDNVQGGNNPLSTPATNLDLKTQDDLKSTEDPTGTLLVNSFHAYGINPAATSSNAATNPAGATALLNYLTSPAAQAAVAQYQIDPTTKKPDFRPDAAPTVTPSNFPDVIDASKTVTITGTVANVVPGTPALDGVTVTLTGQVNATPSAAPVVVATATTKSDGSFSMTFSTPVERTYTLTTPALDGVLEYPAIHPPFADQLQATSTPVTTEALGSPKVQASVGSLKASGKAKTLTVSGSLVPKVHGSGATVGLYAKLAGAGHAYHLVASKALSDGAKTFSLAVAQKPRAYQYYVSYANPGYIEAGNSTPASVTVVS